MTSQNQPKGGTTKPKAGRPRKPKPEEQEQAEPEPEPTTVEYVTLIIY